MTIESTHRVPALDGVRGLAILIVMCYHIFPPAVTLTDNPFLILIARSVGMGWVGVDIFFVLSGFLISSILLNTRHDPHYFKNFYARRVLRIFPLYFLILGAIFLLLPLLSPETARVEQASWPYFVVYLQNWLLAAPQLHLGSVSAYVGPSWSLAIEEQFYLVWPSLVLFLSRRKLAFLSIGIVVLSLAARLILAQIAGSWQYLPHFIYFGSFTRFDGFALGALIALASQSERWKVIFFRFSWPVLITTLAALIAIVLHDSNVGPLEKNYYLNTWGYTLITLASGALVSIVLSGPKDTIIQRFFSSRVLAFFGKYSYAMYLIHLPVAIYILHDVVHLDRNSIKAWLTFVGLSFGLTILASMLTWHLLEKQALKLKKHFAYQVVEG